MRSPDNRHRLIIDTSAAENVRQIFIWAADNISIFEIARRLNLSNIPSPASYISEMSASNKAQPEISGLWHHRTVDRILKNEIYLGRLIQGKTKAVNFVRQPTLADEWIHVSESHEAIVSKELFQAYQALRNKKQENSLEGSRIVYSANIFKGKIYCAHCGGYLERKKNHDKYIYHCVANRIAPHSCVGNRIGENDIKLSVLEQLLQYKDRIGNNNMPSVSEDIIRELQFVGIELSNTQDIARSLYENLVDGVLNATEYRELKVGYQEKTDTLAQRVNELKQMLDDEKRKKINVQKSLRMLDELEESKVLAKEYVDQFVERIEIFIDERVFVGLRKFED